MRYAGGKERLAKPITEQLLKLRRPEHTTYIEPFCGGCNILSVMAPHFEKVIGADSNLDLILMWKALQEGWQPPEHVTEAEHSALAHAEPSALRSFVGFTCSFGGTWFGGFDHAPGRAAALLKQAEKMRHVRFVHADYRTLRQVQPGQLIYCDPPYFATFGYSAGARHFDSAEFWNHAYGWAQQGATVAVSEYHAPAQVSRIWSVERDVRVNQKARRTAVDSLFLVEAS